MLNQIRTPDGESSGLYLHLILVEANDSQGFSHHLPVVAVVDGAHFGAVTLRKKTTHVTYNESALNVLEKAPDVHAGVYG